MIETTALNVPAGQKAASAAAVPLSSVRQSRHQLGRTAAQVLLDEALGEASHQHRQVVFEPELVIRRSSQAHLPVPAKRRDHDFTVPLATPKS